MGGSASDGHSGDRTRTGLGWVRGLVGAGRPAVEDSESARAQRRSKTLTVGIATSAVSRVFTALTPLLVVPVGLQYLGKSAYGAWSVALSVTAMLLFADLGIGSGLMTKLGQLGPQATDQGRAYVSSSYAVAGMVAGGGLALLFATSPVLPWAAVLGVEDPTGEVQSILIATIAAFMLNIVCSLIVRVQYGVGQQGVSNVWQIAGSLATIAATYGAVNLDPGHAGFVAIASLVAPIVFVANSVYFYGFTELGRGLRPSVAAASRQDMREMVSLGSRFVLISALLAVTTQSDLWIVSWTSGLDEVPSFSIPYRVTTVVGAFALVLTLPLWPLNAEAVASGDIGWIRRITRRMLLVNGVAVGGLSLLTALLGPTIVAIWLGGVLPTDPVLWAGLAVWFFVQCLTGPAFMVQNGAEVLRPQMIGYVLLVVSLPVKWWVSEHYGTAWIPWVGAVSYALCIWPTCWAGYRQSLELVLKKAITSPAKLPDPHPEELPGT